MFADDLIEFLSYVHRFFPTLVGLTLFIAGLACCVPSWILVSFGGALTLVATLVIQYILSKSLDLGESSVNLLEACSLLPPTSSTGRIFSQIPSVWIAMTTFYCVYIMRNAWAVYTTSPSKVPRNSTAVQQRMGMGLISLVSAALLLLFLVGMRFALTASSNASIFSSVFWLGRSTCENGVGALAGGAIGFAAAIGWWTVLHVCDSTLSDVHQVLGTLKGGASLRANPLICG